MINIVTALHCEAKSVISHFKLKQYQCDSGFNIFINDSISLIVTGVGKLRSSAGTAYLQGRINSNSNTAWLNIGIAGHSNHEVGCGFLVHKITDAETGENWHPVLPVNADIRSTRLITFNIPNQNYDNDNSLYDMEAAGFYAAASRFSTSDLIQCYKVVSDNDCQSVKNITKSSVANMIGQKIPDIEQIIIKLEELSNQLQPLNNLPTVGTR